MKRTKPPFRADIVGSFLRTEPVHAARTKHEKGEITAAQLKAVEDDEIRKLIKKQEAVGLKAVPTANSAAAWWHFDFLAAAQGVEVVEAEHGIQFQGVQTKAQTLKVTARSISPPITRCSTISAS